MTKRLLLLLVLFAVGCGDSSPTAPTPQIPSINGQWAGAYRITTCSENAVAAGFCAAVGAGGTHVLTPSQTGGNFTGQLAIGGFTVPVSGNVDTAGVVTLAGSGPVSFATLSVTAWRAVISGSAMSGTMTYTVFAPDGGTATVSATTSLVR